LAYRVRITESALADARDYVRFIRDVKQEPEAADRWYRGLAAAVVSLEESPSRCPLIPESAQFTAQLRHLIYYSHRIIFQTEESTATVHVVRVYHGARRALRPEDTRE